MPQYFKNHGERLLDHGYAIVPLPPGSKGPNRKGWQHLKLDRETFHRMAANGSANDGAGVLAAHVPAIDVDVLDESVAEEMNQVLETMFGTDLLARVGQAPKFLVPFRTDEPFRKLSSARYTDGADDHRIEILGDGQQWVAFHVHPATGKPYYWGGGRSILDVEWKDLPVLTRDDAQKVIEAFEAIAARKVEAGEWWLRAAAETPSKPVSDDPFLSHTPPLKNLPEESINWLIGKYDAEDHKQWIDIGMMFHHQFEASDEGFALWDSWSAKASNYDPEETPKRWQSFGQRTDAPVTFKSAIDAYGQPPKPAPALPTGATEEDPFPFYPGDEYSLGFENVSEMVEDLLPDQGTGMVYGASQSGKTFWAMDVAFHVHNGEPWRGKEVKRGPVFYIAAEAGRGIRKRIAAYKAVNPEAVSPFFADTAPDLLDLVWVNRIKDSILLRGGASLVVIDTMSASFTGDDSSQQETAVMVQNCGNLAKSLECLVLFVHHAKKDGASWRGSGVLYNDNDVVIEISADGEGDARSHCAHVVKQRDDEAGQKFGFRLVKSGKLGQKPNGKPITSCTIDQTEDKPAPKGRKTGATFEQDERYGKSRHYLDILAGLAGLGNDRVEVGIWINAIQNDPVVTGGNPEPDYPRADSLTRSFHRLAKQGKISIEGRYVRLLA
jgi:hypothetical protein